MRRVSALMDRVLGLLQWPVALVALAILPGAALAFADVVRHVAAHPGPLWFFLAGAAAYALVFELLLRRTWFGSYFSTLEHELTHALFAFATFHRVRNLRVTRHDGGHVEILGGTNWLISLAPYFFPTLTLGLLTVLYFLPPAYLHGADLVLGAAFAYHLFSTLRETHPGQPDFRAANRLFTLAFLPTANLIVLGLLFRVALADTAGLATHLSSIAAHTRDLYHRWT